ncbi:MAG: histidine kinase N-terminal 7TM domain-containing protein [Acidobacteriota bacterium]
MNWQYNHFSLLYFLSAAVAVWLFLYGWKRRRTRGAVPFIAFAIGVFIWSFANGIEVISLTLAEKIFWANVQYFGATTIPVAWIVFALQYTGRASYINTKHLLLLCLLPAITIVLAWTNPHHELIRKNISLTTEGLFPRVLKDYGVWFKIYVIYSYTLLGAGVFLIFNLFVKANQVYRKQALVLLLGALTPWCANIVYILQIAPLHHLDLTPPAFTVAGIAMALGIFRFHLLDIIPIAYETVIEELQDGIIVLDTGGRIIDLNPAAQKILDQPASEVIGLPFTDFIAYDLDSDSSHNEICRKETFYDVKHSLIHDKRGKLSGKLVVLRDITEPKRLEAQLAQVEKLAAVGRFLSGTAHELNNPLSSILGFAQLLLAKNDLDKQTRKRIEIINQEATRSRTIVQNLFAFVGESRMIFSNVNINELLNVALELRKDALQPQGIEVRFEPGTLPEIKADAQQLERAFLNVLINAEQALQTVSGKKLLTITTELKLNGGQPRIEVSIEDTGAGIPGENLNKVFEPFFTTRPVGKGMGLGLSISYGIIAKHGGNISVESKENLGSKFIFSLPVTAALVVANV